MASFTVADSLQITLTTTGSGVLPTDVLKTYYILPADDTTEVEIAGTSFTVQQYQAGKIFNIPSESVYFETFDFPNTNEAKFIVRNISSGVCQNTESARGILEGILLEETGGGGGGGGQPECVLHSSFKTGSTDVLACAAGTTSIYINGGPYADLADIPNNPRIYTDAGCTSLAPATFISDGTFSREWNGSDTLDDAQLC